MMVQSGKWPRVRLAQVLSPIDRSMPTAELGEINIAGVFSFGRGLFKRGPLIPAETSYKSYNRLHEDDFVISQPKAWEGALGRVPKELEGWYLSPVFPTFRCNESELDPRYLERFCQRQAVWIDLQSKAKALGARRETVSVDQFLTVEIPLPPLPEQKRIAARIEATAQELARAQTIRASSDLASNALLTATVSARFAGDSLWRPLRDAVLPTRDAVRSGPFGSQLLHEEFTSEGVAAIGTRDVQTDRFDLTSGWFVTPEKFETFKRYKVYPGDLLCTIVGASIGRFCVVPPEVPDAFTTKHIQALTLNSEVANSRFCSLMLNFHRRSRASLFSQVEGSAQPSLNAAKVLATQVPLPPLAEQRRVVAEVDALQTELLALKRAQAQSRAELDALLPAILDRAFAGAL